MICRVCHHLQRNYSISGIVNTRASFFNPVNFLVASLSAVFFVRVLDAKTKFYVVNLIG